MTGNYYPLLTQLRGARLAREAELLAPVRARARRAEDAADALRSHIAHLEKLLRSPMVKEILERIGRHMAQAVADAVKQAAAKARPSGYGTLVVRVPIDVLMAADPRDVERCVMGQYQRHIAQHTQVFAPTDISEHSITRIRVVVPQLNYEVAVNLHELDRMRA